jgi:hypothetical protein
MLWTLHDLSWSSVGVRTGNIGYLLVEFREKLQVVYITRVLMN